MMPTMNLDNSAHALNAQSDLKAVKNDYYEYQHSDKHWSKNPTSRYTTSLAEGVISEKYARSHFYNVKRTEHNKFEVYFDEIFDQHHNKQEFDHQGDHDVLVVSIPLFRRVHVVVINDDNTMACSCCTYEVCGLFCEHQICVAEFIYKHANQTFDGFTHQDIALRHTSAYMHLAYRAQTPPTLQMLFDEIIDNESRGPTLGIPMPENIPIMLPSSHLPAIDRLKNYSKESATIPRNVFDDSHIFEHKPKGSDELDSLFSESIENFDVPDDSKSQARDLLKGKVDLAYKMADRLGTKGVKELDRVLDLFVNWVNKEDKQYSKDKDDIFPEEHISKKELCLKRKYVPMTKCPYTGSAKRVYNTKNM